jgi:DNA-binding LytR/AlgR family response regulator
VLVKADKKLTRVALDEVSHIEAYGNYIFIYRQRDRILSKQTLTQFQEQLPADRFIRVHKSHIVALKAVQYLEGNELSLGEKKIPVGKVYRENVRKHFQ